MTHNQVRTRIAPSPTGDWHLGNARTALFSYLFARNQGGKFFLRVEDTDQAREVKGAVDRLLEILNWLGMQPDLNDQGKLFFLQSENLKRYQGIAHQLVEMGKAYYCFATPEELAKMRQELQSQKMPPRYDDRWGYRDLPLDEAKKRIENGDSFVIRHKMPQENQNIIFHDEIHGEVSVQSALLDDYVLLKADGFPTYHLAHVVDDHDQMITHVIRGDEWLASAPKHIQLHHDLEWKEPIYAHVPVILGPDKGKLSKRHGAKPVIDYKNSGYLPEALLNYLLFLGWSSGNDKEIFSRDEMIAAFSLKRVHPSPAVFDAVKLDWFNASYIRQLDTATLRDLLLDYLKVVNPLWLQRYETHSELFDAAVASLQERISTFADFSELAEIFFSPPAELNASLIKIDPSLFGEVIRQLEQVNIWEHDNLETLLRNIAQEKNVKAADLLWTVRYALTGQKASAGAFEMLTILGKDESLRRLQTAKAIITAS